MADSAREHAVDFYSQLQAVEGENAQERKIDLLTDLFRRLLEATYGKDTVRIYDQHRKPGE